MRGRYENQDSLESGHREHAERADVAMLELGIPSHGRLCYDKREGLVRGDEESVA